MVQTREEIKMGQDQSTVSTCHLDLWGKKWNKWENHAEKHDLPQREIMHRTIKEDSTESRAR